MPHTCYNVHESIPCWDMEGRRNARALEGDRCNRREVEGERRNRREVEGEDRNSEVHSRDKKEQLQ